MSKDCSWLLSAKLKQFLETRRFFLSCAQDTSYIRTERTESSAMQHPCTQMRPSV